MQQDWGTFKLINYEVFYTYKGWGLSWQMITLYIVSITPITQNILLIINLVIWNIVNVYMCILWTKPSLLFSYKKPWKWHCILTIQPCNCVSGYSHKKPKNNGLLLCPIGRGGMSSPRSMCPPPPCPHRGHAHHHREGGWLVAYLAR